MRQIVDMWGRLNVSIILLFSSTKACGGTRTFRPAKVVMPTGQIFLMIDDAISEDPEYICRTPNVSSLSGRAVFS